MKERLISCWALPQARFTFGRSGSNPDSEMDLRSDQNTRESDEAEVSDLNKVGVHYV